jgi:hypothetical protein
VFALYVAGYSGFRIFEELLRTDPAHHVLGLRLNFFVAALLCLAGLAWFARTQRAAEPRPRRSRGGPAALGVGWLVCVLAGCGHGSSLAVQQAPTPPVPAAATAATAPTASTASTAPTAGVPATLPSVRSTGVGAPPEPPPFAAERRR